MLDISCLLEYNFQQYKYPPQAYLVFHKKMNKGVHYNHWLVQLL